MSEIENEDIIGDIIANEGADVAGRLIRIRGGREKVYFPMVDNLNESHWLVDAVGMKNARSICKRIGGGCCAIRKNLTKRVNVTIKNLIEQGKSSAEIASEVGVHQRTVRRHRRRLRLQAAMMKRNSS